MSNNKKIEQWEVERYWEIFSSLVPPGGKHLSGESAATVLKNSRLRDDQLERVWDLSDVDNDGQLDFEEFCVAMRVVFDLVNGEYADVPKDLPDWLVPESKAHLVQATRAVSGGGDTWERPSGAGIDDDDEDGLGLKDGFDWYMSPQQKSQYEDIYTSAKDGHGYVAFDSLVELYASLDVPDTDVRSAWNLVNPSADEVISKDAALAFLHILRGRHDGYRLPRTVPPSLRATFDKHGIDYNVERVRNQGTSRMGTQGRVGGYDESTTSGRKAKFGDSYLSRLQGGGSRGERSRGTDFSSSGTTSDWEEVRLKKQLKELEQKIDRVETAARKRAEQGRTRDSKPALVKRELEQLLDWKRRELRDLEQGEGKMKEGAKLNEARGEIETVREQVKGLEDHLKKRRDVLEGLKQQLQAEKAR